MNPPMKPINDRIEPVQRLPQGKQRESDGRVHQAASRQLTAYAGGASLNDLSKYEILDTSRALEPQEVAHEVITLFNMVLTVFTSETPVPSSKVKAAILKIRDRATALGWQKIEARCQVMLNEARVLKKDLTSLCADITQLLAYNHPAVLESIKGAGLQPNTASFSPDSLLIIASDFVSKDERVLFRSLAQALLRLPSEIQATINMLGRCIAHFNQDEWKLVCARLEVLLDAKNPSHANIIKAFNLAKGEVPYDLGRQASLATLCNALVAEGRFLEKPFQATEKGIQKLTRLFFKT